MPIKTKDYKDFDFVVGVRTNSGAWIEVHALRGKTTPHQKKVMLKIVNGLIQQHDVPVFTNQDIKGGD